MHNGIGNARPDRRRGFQLLWAANLLNGLGSNLLWFALPLYVFQLTGRASAASTAFVVGSLPRLLVGSIGGIVADRVDRRTLLVWCNLLSAAAIAPMLAVREARLVWLLFVCSFGDFLLSQLSNPAERALIPALAERDSLGRANALLASVDSFIRLAGPALGGVIYGISGFRTVVLLDAGSYVAAALLIGLLRLPATSHAGSNEHRPVHAGTDLLAGFRLLAKSRALAPITLINLPAMLAEGIVNALWVVWVTGDLGASPQVFGGVNAVAGAGALLGSVVLSRRIDDLGPRRVFVWSTLGLCVELALIVALPSVPVTALLVFLAGPSVIGFFVGTDVALQRGTSLAALGRVLGALSAFRGTVQIAGALFARQFAGALGVRAMIAIAAACWLIATVTAHLALANRSEVGETGACVSRYQR